MLKLLRFIQPITYFQGRQSDLGCCAGEGSWVTGSGWSYQIYLSQMSSLALASASQGWN